MSGGVKSRSTKVFRRSRMDATRATSTRSTPIPTMSTPLLWRTRGQRSSVGQAGCDGASIRFREPYPAVRAGHDVGGGFAPGSRFDDIACWRDAADLVGVHLREPQIAVRPGRDPPELDV